MRVAYLHPNPRPDRPELDAAVRGAALLAEHFPGPMMHLYPGKRLTRFVPRWLCGIGRRDELRRLDGEVDSHLLFSDQLRPYPFLARLKKPVVYSMMTSLPAGGLPLLRPRPSPDRWLVVPTIEDRKLLESKGYRATVSAAPGLDRGGTVYSKGNGKSGSPVTESVRFAVLSLGVARLETARNHVNTG